MSGSDTESSCGWTLISNEGSDIETLGTEAVEDVEPAPVNSELQKVTLPDYDHAEVKEDSLDVTLVDAATILDSAETGVNAARREHVSVLSSSDHSDILTLGDLKEDEPVTTETSEELYLGMSCSSQYTFTSSPTGFPVQLQVVPHSSSSEEEPDLSSGAVVRRRRVRRNTPNTTTEPDRDEGMESDPSEGEERPHQQCTAEGEEPTQETQRHKGGSILITCILLTLIIAISLGIGHLYDTNHIQIRQFTCGYGMDGLRHLSFQDGEQKSDLSLKDLDVQKAISVLSETIDKIRKENEGLYNKYVQIQTQRDELEMLLKTKAEEKIQIESQHHSLQEENHNLKHSLQKEERSLSVLHEELRTLRLAMKDFEAMRAGADLLLSENQRLKAELEEEKEVIRSFSGKREGLMIEAQTLRKKLDKERKVADEMRGEINKLRQQINGAEKAQDLQSHLMELEKRLSFEQQRSDLWERLYLETKERAKGDSEPKRKSKSKQGMAGKVKETFDAVKNSTKEFVHHHKEQIKKAKEAVKENLRKFSDSVKSTFRNFKDSASTIFNKARGFYDKHKHRNADETWQHRSGKPHKKPFKFNFDFFQSNHFSRNSGDKVHEKFKPQSCSEVFDCAYQEFMSLFNKAAEPVRADEFYQLLQSYLQKEVDHFPYWIELERFINNFFHNGLFIHDQMLFTDFVNDVEDFLTELCKHQGLNEDFFEDLDDYIYKHFFGETYSKKSRPSGPFERPDSKENLREKHRRKQHRSRHSSERKWSRSDQNRDRHMADVKIELGPMPFDPKY
ncbi:cell cycle progression protein 1 isoform X1 [Periophthalmus magnuspinnatus]|uniref:cell cycle progression protein 1 isoform X1 n=1 Tax=Periophthalmus magnuspinnatus TaxID=409849 RepID=UPI00145AEFEA|nr:cell cycle progression protein 1 isoform X1 [Periophthalmus magnuspinnatus]